MSQSYTEQKQTILLQSEKISLLESDKSLYDRIAHGRIVNATSILEMARKVQESKGSDDSKQFWLVNLAKVNKVHGLWEETLAELHNLSYLTEYYQGLAEQLTKRNKELEETIEKFEL